MAHRACCSLLVAAAMALAACGRSGAPPAQAANEEPPQAADGTPKATPKAVCGPGSRPESGLQGRLSKADIDSGLAPGGIRCNTEIVGYYTHQKPYATIGGWKVERYVDRQGHECAYYDASNIFPLGILDNAIGVNVIDMTDPAQPVFIRHLVSPAMLSPHESLLLHHERGLLVSVMGTPAFGPGIVDVYDVSQDCRDPQFKSSALVLTLGHESGISPDGRTFFSATPVMPTMAAIDISDPAFPKQIWASGMSGHGVNISADGNRAYVADSAGKVIILDITQIQNRTPFPQVPKISEISWESGSIPQTAIPITIKGKPFLVETDEFGSLDQVGAGRIIDISDEKNPKVISNLRLEVHQPENFETIADDPGADNSVGGYAAHFCNVPTRVDPTIVACGMLASGLRVFDIRDPYHPREVAYFHPPLNNNGSKHSGATSSPAFAPERKEIWYSDSDAGFYAVRVTNGAWQ